MHAALPQTSTAFPPAQTGPQVASWLLAILRPTDEGTAPSNQEAVALLADFCAGLRNPDLPTPPRVEAMRAVTTLIPHYQVRHRHCCNVGCGELGCAHCKVHG